MTLIFTGNGKGKTTAAIGQGIRAIGQGKKVFMIQFIKSEGWPKGEEKVIRELAPRFTLVKGGKGFVGIMGDKLPREVHKAAAEKTLELAKEEILSRKYDLSIKLHVMTTSYFKFKNGYEIGGYWYPRVTAICGILAKPGLLKYYANQENFTKAQESLFHASYWGKTAHEVMGKILKREKVKVPSVISHSILAFEEWKAQHKISIFDIEKRVFSKEHWY